MKKKQYVAPTMELMNARVEKGFAGSGQGTELEHIHDGQIIDESDFE